MRWVSFTICSKAQKRLTGGAEAVQQSFGFSLGAGFGAEVELELGLGAGGADGEPIDISEYLTPDNSL